MTLVAVFIAAVFLYSLVSDALARTPVTAAMVFTSVGLAVPHFLPETHIGGENRNVALHIAEVGLVLLLFTDASRTNWRMLKSLGSLPLRLLSTGMLLTLLLGTVMARLVFPQLSIWEAGILSAILAPTDAGLGQIIVTSPLVPIRVRQALNVEAGLNDGLAIPFLMFFLALVQTVDLGDRDRLGQFMIEQLGYGSLIGAGIGLVGGGLLGWASRYKWMGQSSQQLGVVALPLLAR